MKNSSVHHQTRLEPFWNAILAGTIVSLIVLNVLPSAKIQYLYRVKAVATQQRFDAFNVWLKKHAQKSGVLGDLKSDGQIRFLAAEAIDTPRSNSAPVLSTNHALPERLLAQITFLSDKRFASDEIQKRLEEISFTQCKAQEVQELERQVRLLEWQKTSAEHLANQLDASEASSLPLLTVSTNPIGSSTLLKDWKGLVEKKTKEHDQLTERLRTAAAKAHGFIAVAGKPEVFPRTANPLPSSTIIAFVLGFVTSGLFFLYMRYVQVGASQGRLALKADHSSRSYSAVDSDQGRDLAVRLAKLGIPVLGSIAATGDRTKIEQMLFAAASLEKGSTDKASKIVDGPAHLGNPLKSISGSTAAAKDVAQGSVDHRATANKFVTVRGVGSQGHTLSIPLQRAIEWMLILWLSIGALRFLTDDMWRGLFFHSPLTGIAKLLSGFA